MAFDSILHKQANEFLTYFVFGGGTVPSGVELAGAPAVGDIDELRG